MDPMDAPALLSTPIARIASDDTPPLYTLYGTSSLFVRIEDDAENVESANEQKEEPEEEMTSKYEYADSTVMIVPLADLVKPSTCGFLSVCATVGFFVIVTGATCLFMLASYTPVQNTSM